MRDERPSKEELDADLESFVREIHKSNSDRPPAERLRLVQQLEAAYVARRIRDREHRERREEMVDFERERREREADSPFSLGRASDSGIHDIRTMEQAFAARDAAKQIELEKDALKERLRRVDARILRNEVIKWAVIGLLTVLVGLLYSLAKQRIP